MTAVKAADVDRFLARPDPAQPIVLIYGPDAGLVRERADALVRASVDDPADPFSLVRLEGEDLTANPARLVEEAHTVPLFGGRRAVLVKAGSRNIAPAVESAAAQPSADCRIIIEAGDLKKSSPLRAVCEKAKTAAALLALIGGDRLASRNEVRKLALYGRGKERIELADVTAVVADASALALDGVLDSAFAGRTADTESEFGKARAGGSSPAAIISAAIRHVANLHKMRLAVDGGDSTEFAMKRGAPPIHFSREKLVGEALRSWSAPDKSCSGG